MTTTPTWAGAWRQVDAPRSRWTAFVCGWKRHVEDESNHHHDLPDWRYCWRCGVTWRRDGCEARQCGERRGRA